MVIIQAKSDSVGAVSYTDDLRYNYEIKDTSTSTASDYANAGASPTLVAFAVRDVGSALTLTNTVGGADPADYVRFTVPAGERLSSFKLTAYESADGLAFIGIQAGTVVTATPQYPSVLKGYTHFGSGASGASVGSELIAKLGGPLEPGDYSLWIQQLGAATSYVFTLTTEKDQDQPVGAYPGAATYSISPAQSIVNEGSPAAFTVTTTNVAAGTALTYTLTGISAADIVGGALSGTIAVGSNGQATISVPIAADQTTEGDEKLTVTIQSNSASVTIKDTSIAGAVITGTTNADALVGTAGADTLNGLAGNDTLTGGLGNDVLEGGDGVDVAVFAYPAENYRLELQNPSPTVSFSGPMIAINPPPPTEGTDSLTNIERLEFSDKLLAINLQASAGQVAKTLGTVFGKAAVANKAYVGIGLHYADHLGYSYESLMQLAISARLSANPSNGQVVDLLYTNVVGQAPDTDTRKVYTDLLDNRTYTVASLGVLAADTDLNKANINLAGLSQTGLEYSPFTG
jgi:Ca2+-binding RTX toxin-like protein